ncbi:MAG: hypothetical protein PUK34_07895 [Clostridia bacterium]|nr:hypothetical protein [Clostridia bacterium]
MRKKQFLALLLAGTLTVSMAPVAFVQAEAIEEAGVASEMAEEISAAEEPSQAETPAEEPGEASPEETPAETQPSEETAAGGPSGEAAETQPAGSPETADAFIEAGEAEVSPADGEEDTPKVYILSDGIMTEQASLADAIANAGDISGEIASDTQPTQIVVTGTVELTAPVVIQNKYISISAGETGAEIRRSGFEGDMFTVEANSALEFALTRSGEEESADVYGLTVSGDSGAVSAGSIVAVKAGGYLGIAQAVTLTGNYSSVNGSAIRNEGGKVALFGGNISGNRTSAANGAAVYNTGELDLIGTVYVADNASDAEGQEDANVLLSGENAKIVLLGGLSSSKVLFTADSALVDKQVIFGESSGMAMADILSQVQYSETVNYKVDADGFLRAKGDPEPEPTPVPTVIPMTIKEVNTSWNKLDRNAAEVTFQSNKAGYYYATWAARDEGVPACDKSKGVKLPANTNVTAYVDGFDSDKSINVYVYAWSAENEDDMSNLIIQLSDASRPAKEEEPTVTPTPTTRAPYQPSVSQSTVQGLEQPLAFYPGKTYSFTVTGAGTENTDPVKDDVKWVPLYWSSYSKPTTSQRQSIGTIGHKTGIQRAATFNMYIFCQKYVYDGTQWQPTDVVESFTYQFKSQAIEFTTSPVPTITPSGYDSSGNPIYGTDGDGTNVDDPENKDGENAETGVTSTSANAKTADNSPIGAMMMLASLSLLAGGYVIVRKRKKA